MAQKKKYTVKKRKFIAADNAQEVWGATLGYDSTSKKSIPGTGVASGDEVFIGACLLYNPKDVVNNVPNSDADPVGFMALEFAEL